MTDFLDDYTRFLHGGQGRRIRARREALGLTRTAFAQAFHIPEASLQNWEEERKKLSYKSWERYFKGKVSCPPMDDKNKCEPLQCAKILQRLTLVLQ